MKQWYVLCVFLYSFMQRTWKAKRDTANRRRQDGKTTIIMIKLSGLLFIKNVALIFPFFLFNAVPFHFGQIQFTHLLCMLLSTGITKNHTRVLWAAPWNEETVKINFVVFRCPYKCWHYLCFPTLHHWYLLSQYHVVYNRAILVLPS